MQPDPPPPAPLVQFVESTRSLYEQGLPAGVGWDDVLDAFERLVSAQIAERGVFRVNTLPGVFVCS